MSLVKTDRSFIEQISDVHTVPPLVAAMATLCAALGLTGVAEGTGTEEQYTAVRNHGYRPGHGYLLGDPSRSGHITARLLAVLDQPPAIHQPAPHPPAPHPPAGPATRS